MKRMWLTVGASICLTACGGGQTTDESAGAADGPADVVVDCDASATEARGLIETSTSVSPATPAEFDDFYGKWRAAVTAWNSDDHVCLAEGPSVMDRLTTHKELSREFEAADLAMQDRLAPSFVPRPNASAYFDVLFAGGTKPSSEARGSAFNVARAEQSASFKAFKEFGWGILDDKETTTCITSNDKIDPQAEVTQQMLKVFEGKTDVHVLCRLPTDASTFGGDPNGELKIELNTDTWESEPVTAVALGKPEKWGKTRYFTARFAVPLSSSNEAETYRVNLVARRPEMGDERIVGTTFWWHR